jgi:hypothetical protein
MPIDMDKVAPEHRERVEAMIPKEEFASIYTHRHITSDLNGAKYYDFDVFEKALKLKHNVLLPGPSGAGKTTAMRAFAAEKRIPFVSVEFQGGFDFSSVIGSIQANEDGLPRWVDGELTLAVRYPSVIGLDEVNFAPPRFTAGTHGLLDVRQSLYLAQTGERVAKNPGTLIISAYNPGYLGVSQLNEAFKNRYAYTIEWGYDAEVEEARVGKHSPRLLEMVRNMRKLEQIDDFDIGTNLMEEFIMIAKSSGIGLASHVFLHHFEGDVRSGVHDALTGNLWDISSELGVDADA